MSPRARFRWRRFMAVSSVVVAQLSLVAPTLAAPSSSRRVERTGNGQHRLYIVGDSLTVGATAFGSLTSRVEALDIWSGVEVDARFGRKATTGARLIEGRIARAPEVTAIVVALGTNDLLSHASRSYPRTLIDQVMTTTGDLPVLWVNTEFSTVLRRDWASRAVRFNRALVEAHTRWPNLSIADWNGYFTPGKVNRFVADGVHLTVSAYRLRARWLARQIQSFGTSIVNATTTTTSTTSTTAPTSTSITSTTSTTTTTIA